MRFTLPKNSTAPLILFAIFSVLVSFILGLYHISQVAQYSYETNFENFDTITKDLATTLKQEVENDFLTMQISANLVAKTGNLTKDNIITLLSMISQNNTFTDLQIVNMQGKGYNIQGEEVNVAGESYFEKVRVGLTNSSNKIIYTVKGTPVIVYAVPISDNDVIKGALIANISASQNKFTLLQNQLDESSIIYLINADHELISYAQDTDIVGFDYNKIISNGYFYSEGDNSSKGFKLNEFFTKKSQNKKYMWNEKPLGINNWSVLVGRPNIISPVTLGILRLTNIIWIFITLGTIFLFILMITFQRKSNRNVIRTLYLDPVTGGDNWYKFRISVNKILNSKQFSKMRFAIINFDINRFRIINDAYGYQKGDEVLRYIYNVIKKWVIPGEPFTRYAADQFYILMSFHDDKEVIQRINDLNDRLHQLRYMNTSRIFYGIYYITESVDSIDRMGEFAGIAKNNIKGNADGIMSFFDDLDKSRLLEEEEIEKSMNDALKNNEFQVYLQPKYTAIEETISGAEALVRWQHENGDLVSPGDFIPVFEKNGFITELDYYMLKKVCIIIRGWLDKGYIPLPISVNISRLHFANPQLADIIKDIVDNYEVPRQLIELELTESAFLQNKQALINTVTQLRKYGFLVSMDDFGAGYSSLNSLKDLPLDVVKLDGELFRMTEEVERGLTVVRNTIIMAKDLHMKVVAECIETKDQVEFLCTVGCDIIQGYYFAKPMPLIQFEERYFSLIGID